jgi:hypothetical protein
MPLIKPTLKTALKSGIEPKIKEKSKVAFKKAMEKFREESQKAQSGNNFVDVFSAAVEAASTVFSDEMKKLAEDLSTTISNEVDTYIKSATIIVPPGITIAGAGGGPAPVTGATIAPSAPATIS